MNALRFDLEGGTAYEGDLCLHFSRTYFQSDLSSRVLHRQVPLGLVRPPVDDPAATLQQVRRALNKERKQDVPLTNIVAASIVQAAVTVELGESPVMPWGTMRVRRLASFAIVKSSQRIDAIRALNESRDS
ncbi:MAG: hypothetical protein WDN27_06900 [Candidatus Saccharibacteria bacterium]